VQAIKVTGVLAPCLNEDEVRKLRIRLLERLAVDVCAYAPWDAASAPKGTKRSDGWQLITDFVSTNPCLMFLDGTSSVWSIRNGGDLRKVLAESPALEFYVCDDAGSYLLCSNHHDFVVGWGSAQRWVDDLEPN